MRIDCIKSCDLDCFGQSPRNDKILHESIAKTSRESKIHRFALDSPKANDSHKNPYAFNAFLYFACPIS